MKALCPFLATVLIVLSYGVGCGKFISEEEIENENNTTNGASETPGHLYDIKDMFSKPEDLDSYLNVLREASDPSLKFPIWSFELTKAVCHPGEAICGRLTIKNEDPKYNFAFTPPFRGALVDNVEIWFRPKNSDEDLKRVSLFLKRLFVNTAGSFLRRGVPILLPPGGKYEIFIPINSYYADNTDRNRHQFAGAAVMTEPGEYEFYIRYLNTDRTGGMPTTVSNKSAYRRAKNGKIYDWNRLRGSAAIVGIMQSTWVPIWWRKPVVLGPFNVKVEPWPEERENEMAKKIAAMWKRSMEISHKRIVFPKYDPELVKEALKVFPPSKDEPDSIGSMLKMHDWIVRYPDFENIRYREASEEPVPEEQRVERLKKMLAEIRLMKTDEKPGVLRDLICHWEIRTLIDLGERKEALEKAREYSTPDIMTLIERRIGLVLDKNWPKVGPIRNIPADDYTAPELEEEEEE